MYFGFLLIEYLVCKYIFPLQRLTLQCSMTSSSIVWFVMQKLLVRSNPMSYFCFDAGGTAYLKPKQTKKAIACEQERWLSGKMHDISSQHPHWTAHNGLHTHTHTKCKLLLIPIERSFSAPLSSRSFISYI